MAMGNSKIKFSFSNDVNIVEKYEWCAKVECEITPFDEFQCWFHTHCLARAGDIDISERGNWGCHVSLGCWAAEGNYPSCVRHSPARKGVGPSWIVDDGRTKETDADGSDNLRQARVERVTVGRTARRGTNDPRRLRAF